MQKSRRKCHVRPIIGAASLVLFADVCVKIFDHSLLRQAQYKLAMLKNLCLALHKNYCDLNAIINLT